MSYFTKLSVSIFALFSLSFSTTSFSQNMDQQFLEGLSPEVREQLSESDNNGEAEGLDKLFRSDTSKEKNKAILEKIRLQMDELQERMSEDGEQSNTLKRFGDSFFSSLQSSFMPINIPNFDNSYLVDVGDIFNLMITGSSMSQSEITVLRDGTLTLPGYGKVSIAGKTLAESQAIVSNYLKITDVGLTPYLTLSKARDIQVIVLGGVEQPGVYTLSGGSNIIGALNVAGGINKRGSYRSIELKRNGEILKKVDLYDTFVFGKQNFITSIRSGDVIFVNPASYPVPVSGGVNNPAIYEVLKGETLAQLIEFAGNFSYSFSGFNEIELRRSSAGSSKYLTVDPAKMDEIFIQPRDQVLVPSYVNAIAQTHYIEIEGMVERPGKYNIKEGEKLSSLIARAGGYKKGAYSYGAALFRDSATDLGSEFNERIYADTIAFVISTVGQPGNNLDASVLEIIKEEDSVKRFPGRVITQFDLDAIKTDPSKNITLKDQDRIVIPSLEKIVYSFGDFRNPANMLYQSGLTLSDYIKNSGGFNKSSSKTIIVIDPDGKTNIYEDKILSFSKEIELYPGSIIYAPRSIGDMSPLVYASVVSPILSNLAISLASLNSISND